MADLSYFAPDCFHLSEKGHKAAAEALWNNMVIKHVPILVICDSQNKNTK